MNLGSEWPQGTAIRALPVNPAAGETPQIFLHATIADLKIACAAPTKRPFSAAATAEIFPLSPPFFGILIVLHRALKRNFSISPGEIIGFLEWGSGVS
ncbi:MAG: hypothetical protein ISS61_10305 [Desulfobacteraceae bacterium]|nr:hypothetical protein [Desulfobacteraceae bacterium]